MALLKSLILVLIFASAFLGCEKPKKPVRIEQFKPPVIEIADLKQPEIDQEKELLGELKNINPFSVEHSMELANAVQQAGLKGVVWDTLKPFAVIGDKVVVEGNEIDGKRIIKINKDSVILDNNGEKEVLRLE